MAFSLFVLRRLSFDCFAFPHWQSVLAVTLIGILVGLGPNIRADSPDEMPAMSLWLVLPTAVLSVWLAFLIIIAILHWWMKRGQRWGGQGNLLNLVAASWLAANVLGASMVALGVPPLLTLPLWLYSVLVGANALSGAIPKASLSYSIGGIVFALAGIVMAMLGMAPAPIGAG